MVSEFDLIRDYFNRHSTCRADVILGIGDDAALLQPPPGMELAISMDTLVDGIHFDHDSSAYSIGWKVAAVNLSDMAAMGAEPAWATLSVTLPQVDGEWLREFCDGLFDLLSRHDVQLVGGDTSRGPLAITLQMHGFVPAQQALRRSTASVGDMIYLSGYIGDAGLALWCRQHKLDLPQPYGQQLMAALDQPEPRVRCGMALRGLAASAIDISDGLLADLGHICQASQVGAVIKVDELPQSPAFAACARVLLEQGLISDSELLDIQLSGGDDYELCFTVPLSRCHDMENQTDCYSIGSVAAGGQVRCSDALGRSYTPQHSGFDHFG